MTNMFKRLDYLFKVIENGAMFSPAFTDKCIKEIDDSMTIEEEIDEKEDK